MTCAMCGGTGFVRVLSGKNVSDVRPTARRCVACNTDPQSVRRRATVGNFRLSGNEQTIKSLRSARDDYDTPSGSSIDAIKHYKG